MLLLIQCVAFSQKVVLNKTGDTLIGYTLSQNDFIIKELRDLKYYKILGSINQKIHFNDSIAIHDQRLVIKNDSLDNVDFKSIIRNDGDKFTLKDNECAQLKQSLKVANKTIMHQKIYKWCAIIIGAGVNAYVTYKLIR